MSDELMLDVGQANELKLAFRRTGWTGAEIKILCEGDILAKFLQVVDGLAEIVAKKLNLLKFLSQVKLRAIRRFKPANSIKVGVAGITYLEEDFQKVFLSDMNWQELDSSTANIKSYELLSNSVDGPIRQELGSGHEVFLAHFLKLLSCQSEGQKGFLLTNGWANIFYIKDATGTVWAVRARWLGVGWNVLAYSVGSPLGWAPGGRVVAR